MNDVLRYLGIEVVGGHHTNITRRIKAYGISTSHFRHPSRVGVPKQRRTPEQILVAQEPTKARRMQSDRLRWAMAAVGVVELCAMCGTEPLWQGHPLPLEVDHIDGDWQGRGRAKGRQS
ncbi:hypothetical protein [Streptomyces longisporoflavus]|uniref:hypothetical protein n=1 Tax=Streptomyces longisporoflavus TaxID=28044 RepID=UPI003570C559